MSFEMKNITISEHVKQIIDELHAKAKLNRNETDLLELYALENPSEHDIEKFKFLLEIVVGIEQTKRKMKQLNDRAREMYKAESPKVRNKQLAEKGLDLIKIGLCDEKTGRYSVERLAFLGFLIKQKQHLLENQQQYIQFAEQHLNE